jgi:hypothetical protein
MKRTWLVLIAWLFLSTSFFGVCAQTKEEDRRRRRMKRERRKPQFQGNNGEQQEDFDFSDYMVRGAKHESVCLDGYRNHFLVLSCSYHCFIFE